LRRNLLALDILLLALCGLGCWRFSEFRRERLAEQASYLKRQEVAVPAPVVLMPQPLAPVAAGPYVEVAQKLLLSVDRNPSVILDVVPPKVMPALPRAYGAFDLGEGPRVVLAAKPGDQQRPYAKGETIGEFKIVAITQAGVVFDWDGKPVAASFDEMKDAAVREPTRAAAAPPKAPPMGPGGSPPGGPPGGPPNSGGMQSVASNADMQGRPGAGSGAFRACQPGDKAPAGTVTDGYRKVSVQTPMGASCHWEKVE